MCINIVGPVPYLNQYRTVLVPLLYHRAGEDVAGEAAWNLNAPQTSAPQISATFTALPRGLFGYHKDIVLGV